MKCITVDLSEKLKSVELLPLADIHLGDQHCDMELLKEHIEYVKEHENCFVLLNGDLINNSTKTSIGDVYGEAMKPMEQLKMAIKLFEPIKKKIVAITNGNHEARTYRNDGIDLMEIFARELDLENKYANESALIFLQFGTNTGRAKNERGHKFQFTIYMTHGSGGGRKEGAKAIRLADMSAIVDADIYIHSHTHLPMVLKEAYYRTDFTKKKAFKVDKLFVNTSSLLNYGGYGEMYEFKPSSKDTPKITLSGNTKRKIMTAHI